MEEQLLFKIAINGFGSIGKRFLYALMMDQPPNVQQEVVVNTADKSVESGKRSNNLEQVVLALKNDSLYQSIAASLNVEQENNLLHLYLGRPYNSRFVVRVVNYRNKIDDAFDGVDFLIDTSGSFNAPEKAGLLFDKAGVEKRVLITSPLKDQSNDSIELVYGVNHSNYNPEKHKVISSSSCTTNAVAPIIKLLLDYARVNDLLINNFNVITIHGPTNKQNLDDKVSRDFDPYKVPRSFSALNNIIPTTTGADKSLLRVINDLKNIPIKAVAYRVESQGSIVHLLSYFNKSVDKNSLLDYIKEHSKDYSVLVEPTILTSRMSLGYKNHSIINPNLVSVNDSVVSVPIFYDNVMGYLSNVLRVLEHVIKEEVVHSY